MQAHHANLTFPSFTRCMDIELAKQIVMFLNAIPPNSGLSKTYSPHTIMKGKSLDWKKGCKLHFGAHAQVYKDRNVTNTLEERTHGTICLGPTGNLQGMYNFFCYTLKKITRVQFTEVPTPTIIMKRVAAMSLAEKQNKGLVFENRTGVTVNDILPDDEPNEEFDKLDRNNIGVDWEAEMEIQDPAAYMPQLNNNQYAALTGEEEDEGNDTKSTGV